MFFFDRETQIIFSFRCLHQSWSVYKRERDPILNFIPVSLKKHYFGVLETARLKFRFHSGLLKKRHISVFYRQRDPILNFIPVSLKKSFLCVLQTARPNFGIHSSLLKNSHISVIFRQRDRILNFIPVSLKKVIFLCFIDSETHFWNSFQSPVLIEAENHLLCFLDSETQFKNSFRSIQRKETLCQSIFSSKWK